MLKMFVVLFMIPACDEVIINVSDNRSSEQSCTRGMIRNKIHLSPAQYILTSAQLWPETPIIHSNVNKNKYGRSHEIESIIL